MTDVTNEDRERAKLLRMALGQFAAWPLQDALIAAALAEERERARAPFLALAEEWTKDGDAELDPNADSRDVLIAATFRACAIDIRRAVKAGQ